MNKCIIIAEVGVNHNGSIELAKKHINAAKASGVDYVKFQTFKTEKLVTKKGSKADYQKLNNSDSETQFEMLKKLELSERDFLELNNYCLNNQIGFLSTGFDLESLDFLNEKINQEIFKIPSGEITNYPYLKKVASFGKPVILSTGMATIQEINDSLEVLKRGISLEDITVLHCNTDYPTPMEDVNLKAMLTIKDTFKVSIGYSDHTLGIEIPIAATALGAVVIEKHFTLRRDLPGPDHKASLEPSELTEMVRSIRNIELALSKNGEKRPSNSELKNIDIARKSIYYNRNLKVGETISDADLISLRPGSGISPMEWEKFIGKSVKRNVTKLEAVKWEDIK